MNTPPPNQEQTGQAVIGLSSLWTETLGDAKICIAVLDGPVDLSHPCFRGANLSVVKTLATAEDPNGPALAHGTHVASIIFGQHGSSVWGVAPRCRGVIIPVYTVTADERLLCAQLDLARAINQALVLGANVINISGGELAESGQAEPLLAQAIAQCHELGVLIVAAAGNNGCRCLHVPAALPSVLAVGAMNHQGEPLEFSNWGEAYRKNGIVALGESIRGAAPNGGAISRSGTSFATPIVTGVVALLLSRQLASGEKVNPKIVAATLLETADPCEIPTAVHCPRLLAGRLNVVAATRKLEEVSETARAEPTFPPGVRAVSLTGHRSNAEPGGASLPAPVHYTRQNWVEGPQNFPILPIPENKVLGTKSRKPENATEPKNQITMQNTIQSSETNSQPLPGDGSGPNNTFSLAMPSALATGAVGGEIRQTRNSGVAASAAEASDCGCQKGNQAPAAGRQLIYALGHLGFDFGSEARRDSFTQQTGGNVHDPAILLAYLEKEPTAAADLIWTLSAEATVFYAIQPVGAFASSTYERIRGFFKERVQNGVERISVPAIASGASATLLNGQKVPLIMPEARGMYCWSTAHLVKAVVGEAPQDKQGQEHYLEHASNIQNFLERIYYEIRNLGVTSPERALNFAATDAYQAGEIYADAIKGKLKLSEVGVEKSPLCRPGSDCWDVKMTFFCPTNRTEIARRVYRFTVDVSDVFPVTVGKVRKWDIY